MLPQNFIIIGTVISTLGSLWYLTDTIRGKVKPNRVSFLLWSIVPFIAFAAQIKQGVGLISLMTFSTGFLPFLIFLATFVNKKSEWKITQFDLICGGLSIVGVVLWLITQVGNLAILFSILADGLAAVPTIEKAYLYPETEIVWPWLATFIGSALTLLTLKEWTFANSGFILYMLIANVIITVLVQFKLGKN